MARLGWTCLFLLNLLGSLGASASTSQVPYWLTAAEDDARSNLEVPLSSRSRGALRQILSGLLRAPAEDSPGKAGLLPPNSFTPRESIKEVLLGNLPRNALLSRLLAKERKQNKKRGNLSECFWKYCV